MIRTLILAEARNGPALAPWLQYLEQTAAVAPEVVTDAGALTNLDGFDVLVAHASSVPLTAAEEAGLCEFVARGGGFVALHCTNSHWSSGVGYRAMVGSGPNGRLPESQLVSDVSAPEHDITRRLQGSITTRDSCCGPAEIASDATVLLTTTWRSQVIPVAYARHFGRGRVFYCGLGGTADGYQHAGFRDLLYRGLRYAAGRDEPSAVGVGMLGYGAIGAEHSQAISKVSGLQLAAVCDRSIERTATAVADVPGTGVAADLDHLLRWPEVELIVVSTPPNTHGPLALQALRAGKHVVVEKPFCLTGAEADQLLSAASEAGVTLTVYQNRRWDSDFLALQALVRSGALGEVFHLEAFVGGFDHPCHFWHSDAEVSGGVIFDWGSHYLDWILQLLPGPVVQVSASCQNRVWHDVTNDDHFELRLRFEDGAEAQFTHSDIAAARKPKWYVLGTRGAVVGNWREATLSRQGPNGLVEEHLPVADLPCELHLMRPGGHGRSHDEKIVLPPSPPEAFYRNLAGHLLAQEPLAISPESARRNIAVMEAATAAAASGWPVAVRI